MLRSLFLYPFFILLCSFHAFSQKFFAVSSGFSVDINNNGEFKQIPLSLQYTTLNTKVGALIIKADLGLPIVNKSHDSAYTLQSGLPSAISVQKNIRNYYASAMVGYRFYFGRTRF